MRTALPALLLPALSLSLVAQSTHQVGPGGFAQIRDALAVAAPGDRIDVAPGTYAQFDALVGVTIRATTPGTVDVVFDSAYAPPGCGASCSSYMVTRLQPPVGQDLHVTGVRFLGPGSTAGAHRLEVTGRVTLDHCEVLTGFTVPVRATDARLHLQSTVVRMTSAFAGFEAVQCTNSDFTCCDSTLDGGLGWVGGLLPIHEAVELFGSRMHASSTAISGANSLFGPNPNESGTGAIAADATSSVWICDSSLRAGGSACAVDAAPGALVQLSRCTVSQIGACAPATQVGGLLGVSRPQPLTHGQTFALQFRTDPSHFVLVFAGPQLAADDFPGLLVQPSWVDHTTSFLAAAMISDALGNASASWPIPNNPSLAGLTLWFKGVSGLALPLQTSPVAGGVVR